MLKVKMMIAVLLVGIGSRFVECQNTTEGAPQPPENNCSLPTGSSDCVQGQAEYNVFFLGDDYYNSTLSHRISQYAQGMLNMIAARFKYATDTDVRLRVSGTYALQAGIDTSVFMSTTGGWLNAKETEPLIKKFIAQNEVANRSDMVVLLTGRLVADEKKRTKKLPGFSRKEKVCTAEKYAFIHDPPLSYFGYRNLTHRLGDLMDAYLGWYEYQRLNPPESTPYHSYSADNLLVQYRLGRDPSYNGGQCHRSDYNWTPPAYGPHGFDAVRFCNIALETLPWGQPQVTVNECKIQCELHTPKHVGPVTLDIPDGIPCDNNGNLTSTMQDWMCPQEGAKVCFAGFCNMTYGEVKDLIHRAWNTTELARKETEMCGREKNEEGSEAKEAWNDHLEMEY